MSTRSVIARKTKVGFSGRYHHWDGYPSGLGESLFKIRKKYFNGDTKVMLKVLIDEHPAGWSSILNANFTKPIGWVDTMKLEDVNGVRGWEEFNKDPSPRCFCHGERSESTHRVNQGNASGVGCEYAYVFKGDKMHILSSYWPEDGSNCEGQKMIGMFGMGCEGAEWRPFAIIDLNGREPGWKTLDKIGWGQIKVPKKKNETEAKPFYTNYV